MGRRSLLAVFGVVTFFLAFSLCQAGAELPVYDAATATELLQAIGPNRVIRLTGTEYRLTECADLPEAENPYVRWEKTYDGPELTIAGVSNLVIRGAGKAPAHLVIEPRYAYVIHFIHARNVTLENIRAGHTETGYCTGGVLWFETSNDMRVNRSILYGCGTEGVRLQGVEGFLCKETTIRDCSYYIMTVLNSTDVVFAQSILINNAEFEGIRIAGCRNILFDGCRIRRNGGNTLPGLGLFNVFTSDGVMVKNSIIEENTADYFLVGDRKIDLVKTVMRKNRFAKGRFKRVKSGPDW